MRGIGGSLPGRGAEADPRARRSEPGEDPGCGMRSGGAGGEPDAQAAVRGAGDRAGGSQTGVGAAAGGKHSSDDLIYSIYVYTVYIFDTHFNLSLTVPWYLYGTVL